MQIRKKPVRSNRNQNWYAFSQEFTYYTRIRATTYLNQKPYDTASSHVRVHRVPVPNLTTGSGILNPLCDRLPIGPTTWSETARTSEALLEIQREPSQRPLSNIVAIRSRCASTTRYARQWYPAPFSKRSDRRPQSAPYSSGAKTNKIRTPVRASKCE